MFRFGKNSWVYWTKFRRICNPDFLSFKKGTPLGDPNQILHLGKIELSYEDFEEILRQFSESAFKYSIFFKHKQLEIRRD